MTASPPRGRIFLGAVRHVAPLRRPRSRFQPRGADGHPPRRFGRIAERKLNPRSYLIQKRRVTGNRRVIRPKLK
jgi:hypothetical protein